MATVALGNRLSGCGTWIVVGASQDTSKFGNRIFKELVLNHRRVFGINARGGSIDGVNLHTSLEQLVHSPEFTTVCSPPFDDVVVDVVVPPKVTEDIVKQAVGLGLKNIWMQPGSESEEAMNWAELNQAAVVHHDCIMKHLPTHKS
ncbi:CoA-binding protein [Pelomyxa schiedti]|nr:CoA-binding protein [Pelomyxa schiedti]